MQTLDPSFVLIQPLSTHNASMPSFSLSFLLDGPHFQIFGFLLLTVIFSVILVWRGAAPILKQKPSKNTVSPFSQSLPTKKKKFYDPNFNFDSNISQPTLLNGEDINQTFNHDPSRKEAMNSNLTEDQERDHHSRVNSIPIPALIIEQKCNSISCNASVSPTMNDLSNQLDKDSISDKFGNDYNNSYCKSRTEKVNSDIKNVFKGQVRSGIVSQASDRKELNNCNSQLWNPISAASVRKHNSPNSSKPLTKGKERSPSPAKSKKFLTGGFPKAMNSRKPRKPDPQSLTGSLSINNFYSATNQNSPSISSPGQDVTKDKDSIKNDTSKQRLNRPTSLTMSFGSSNRPRRLSHSRSLSTPASASSRSMQLYSPYVSGLNINLQAQSVQTTQRHRRAVDSLLAGRESFSLFDGRLTSVSNVH